MLLRTRSPLDVRSSEITPERLYVNRRQFLAAAAGAAAGASVGAVGLSPVAFGLGSVLPVAQAQELSRVVRRSPLSTAEAPNTFEEITTYNNFYEFGSEKGDPARWAYMLTPTPWSVKVEGHCNKAAEYHVEDLVRPHALEERIYRLRCVEAWSMVVPWVGFPLADLIRRFEPTSKAKYVEFTTVYRPAEMPGQRRDVLDWPYVEGLRLDEALHPLAIIAVGLYGKVLPNQNGAPLRLVVPWKYGFKGIKSIVRIRFVEHQPINTWQKMNPDEYGFYSNVNPNVDHPRWSQRRERRIGEFFRRPTLMFNGYAAQVAHLYEGMDLKKQY